jgi:hypothetical protein
VTSYVFGTGPPPPPPPQAAIKLRKTKTDAHANAVRARGIFFDTTSKINVTSIAVTASCAGSNFSVRGRAKRATGNFALAGTEIVSATLLAAEAVVAGLGKKLHAKPAGALLQVSCTLLPAFPTAFNVNW